MTPTKPVPRVGWVNGKGEKTSFEVRTVYDLLDVIRQKPGLFIGYPSLTALQAFVNGFEIAMHAIEAPLDEAKPPFGGFHEWIAARFGYQNSARGWKNMIVEVAGDEEAGLARFFAELDDYRCTN